MNRQETKQFLSESFYEGVYHRELRLSAKEVELLRQLYPSASVRKVSNHTVKAWYDVCLNRPEKVPRTKRVPTEKV
ncbi:hypothetical protein H0266_08765 [Halobacillus locisalis]|uniref:Uncharacterized protein n=1 Tax=Halobacillus locisalis TaxID=220753 RepID=A0A838CS71_9BACI|nr:hypothetical protein [Halobacillus locisalis]MBA2174982.1 hypothetical protein [Halobacillus locisalis]